MKKLKAFTLAEVLITVSMIGVVAVMTIPSIHYNYKKSEYRTKVKKAMVMYDSLLRRIYADNFTTIKTDANLYTRVQSSNCATPAKYIKFIQRPGNTCTFQTNDGIWIKLATDADTLWAKVAMTQADLNDNNSDDKEASYKKVVWFFAAFNDGLHVNDQQAADAIGGSANKALTNLYNFIK